VHIGCSFAGRRRKAKHSHLTAGRSGRNSTEQTPADRPSGKCTGSDRSRLPIVCRGMPHSRPGLVSPTSRSGTGCSPSAHCRRSACGCRMAPLLGLPGRPVPPAGGDAKRRGGPAAGDRCTALSIHQNVGAASSHFSWPAGQAFRSAESPGGASLGSFCSPRMVNKSARAPAGLSKEQQPETDLDRSVQCHLPAGWNYP
jgi:hypothetical protein